MARRRKAKKQDSERWMISYADLLTLMLAFFVVLYSQSATDVSRLKEIAAGMITAFHGNPHMVQQQTPGSSGILKHHRSTISTPVPTPNLAPPVPHINQSLLLRIKALQQADKALRKVLSPLLSNHQVKISTQPLSLRIRLNSKILYPSGQATLTPTAKTLLSKISLVLNRLPPDFPIVIQGYTNKKPIHNAQFPSNWELSMMRAVSVVHLFQHNGMPGDELSAEGFSKYHPLNKNDSAAALRENRRVAIVIKAPKTATADAGASLSQLSRMTVPAALPQDKTTPVNASQQVVHASVGAMHGRIPLTVTDAAPDHGYLLADRTQYIKIRAPSSAASATDKHSG